MSIILYGSSISYFTGKMENYFRIREISYVFKSMQFPSFKKEMEKQVGVMQMPAVILEDGRWMTDTTKMIQWFEDQIKKNKTVPCDPVQAFICYLIEDWADEWWWRTAMHYRWHYDEGAIFASEHLASELLNDLWIPMWMKRMFLQYRQRSGYTTGDGINKENIQAIENNFLDFLKNLELIFKNRNFIFGDTPTLADIGLSGPFFRHFALDPVPLKIIRENYPYVMKWVSRLWNTKLSENQIQLVAGIPNDLDPLLKEIGHVYLPYLSANVRAVRDRKKTFDISVGGINFKKARYSRYRVWCIKELRTHFNKLPFNAKDEVKKLLERNHCWKPLWQDIDLPMIENQDNNLPFKADTKMIGVNEPKE